MLLSVVLVAADDSVLFNNIQRLHFHKGKMTRGRRSSPIKQIQCVGGDACGKFEPEVIACKNVGTNDRGEVQWECEAQMEDSYRLGRTDVSCEGFHFSGDPRVLKGSCGVEYTLHLTEKGKSSKSVFPARHHEDPWAMMAYVVVSGIVVVGLLWMITSCCERCARSFDSNSNDYEGTRAPRETTTTYSTRSSRPARTARPVVHNHVHTSNDSGPGFLTGYALGGGFSSRSAPMTTNNYYSAPSAPSSSSSSSSSSWSGWGGSSGGGGGSSSYTSKGYGGSKSR